MRNFLCAGEGKFRVKVFPFKFLLLISLAAVIILFLSVIQYNFDIFPRKMSGSFEYIRKGEYLFGKNQYAKAIKYFEKAYDSSPENETIKSYLVYAHSTYSKALAGSDKYDEAIDCLIKAYNVTPNVSTIQNLAMMYSANALYEAQKGYLSKAEDLYAKMRELADESDIVSQHLGVLLYNDGVSEYKSGRVDTAILCLKESSLVSKEGRTFELLGDMYYKRAEFKIARFYWHRAKILNPNNAELPAKLKKIGKEMALAAKGIEAKLPHFEIRYKKNLPIDKQLAAGILERAYADVGDDLAYFPKARTKVFFYSKEDFRNIFNMPYIVNAFYDGSIKIPSPDTRMDTEKFRRYIYHEYTHALISAKTNNNCPIWLNEGIALWEEFKGQRQALENLLTKIKPAPDISIRFLDESFKTNEVTKDMALCYLLSYTLVKYILDKWGAAGLQGILKRLALRQHIANAIDDEFLLSEKEFERRWRDHTLTNYWKNKL